MKHPHQVYPILTGQDIIRFPLQFNSAVKCLITVRFFKSKMIEVFALCVVL